MWTTPAGTLHATSKCQSTFMMPEFFSDRVLEFDLNVTKSLGAYDMIIGRDILAALGIKFDFTDMSVEWDGVHVPMKDRDANEQESYFVPDPEHVTEATERIKQILDAKYEQADPAQVAQAATHLNR